MDGESTSKMSIKYLILIFSLILLLGCSQKDQRVEANSVSWIIDNSAKLIDLDMSVSGYLKYYEPSDTIFIVDSLSEDISRTSLANLVAVSSGSFEPKKSEVHKYQNEKVKVNGIFVFYAPHIFIISASEN